MATSKPRLDRRIVRSRNAILSAFERLLMEKPLVDIGLARDGTHRNVCQRLFHEQALVGVEIPVPEVLRRLGDLAGVGAVA